MDDTSGTDGEGRISARGTPIREEETHPTGDEGHDGLDGIFGWATGDEPLVKG